MTIGEKYMKIKKSFLDYSMEFICLLTMIGTIAYMVVMWPYVPEQIPVHFNGAGLIDKMGNKNEIFILLIGTWFMYLFLSAVGKIPASWNTGVRSGMKDKLRVYMAVRHLISTSKCIVVLILTYMTIQSLRISDLGSYFMVVSIGIVFINLSYWMIKLFKANKR